MVVESVKYMLLASNMQRAIRFYEEVFEFGRGFVSDHWSELKCNDAIIALHGGHDGSLNPTGLSLQVADACAVEQHIVAAGGTVTSPAQQRPDEPIKLGHFKDPEGNIIMLTEWVG